VKKLIDGSGVKAVVSHQHRYGVHYAKVKEIAASGALGTIHTIYASSPGWMMHMASHLVDYMRWYNGNAEAEWVMGQAAGAGKLSDNHPSPDYIAGFVQFANGVRGVIELGAGAPNVPEVGKWWGRNRIRVMGDQGFAEVLTNGGWRSVTAKGGAQSGDGVMNYAHDTPLYVQDMANWLDDDKNVHPCNGLVQEEEGRLDCPGEPGLGGSLARSLRLNDDRGTSPTGGLARGRGVRVRRTGRCPSRSRRPPRTAGALPT